MTTSPGSVAAMPSRAEHVVIGAGLAGAATAWRLAASGHEVTVLEQGVPADPAGSSHGSARIFRYAYPDRMLTDLVIRSRALWADLEARSGVRLITRSGCLDFGSRRRPHELARVLDEADVEHELLTAVEARRRFPGIICDTDVLWHPGAGVIDAESAVSAMLEQADRAGARLVTGCDVTTVVPRGTGYAVHTTGGATVETRSVVVAAGGWLPSLITGLPLRAEVRAGLPRLTVRQEQAFHFPYRDADAAWPTFIHKSGQLDTYSLPGGRDAGFRGQKLAEFNGGRALRSAADQDGVVDAANRARVVDYVRAVLPGLVPEPYAETTCLFTSTPDERFVVDRFDGLTVVSACSGHGAKFAPLVGAMAARLAAAPTADEGRRQVPESFRVTPRRPELTGVGR